MLVSNRIQLWIILSLLFCFGSNEIVFGQASENWRRQNEKVNRYEGRISLPASVPPIELISFYSYQESYSYDDILMVGFYLHGDFPVYLTAQEIETQEYYWMEAKPQQWRQGWNEFGPWPVSDVLGELEIPPDNLGVLVRLEKETGSGPISPVILYHSSPPTQINRYTAYFRPGKSISSGRYEIYRGYRDNELIKSGMIGRQSAGISFPVKFHLIDEMPGLVKLKITVKIKNESNRVDPSWEFYFYHVNTARD
jgi:hypothetical protein